MGFGSAAAIYFVIWWTVLFAVLPFGIKKSQQEAGEVSPGSDPGAPAVTRIGLIMLANSVLAGIVFAIFWVFLLPLV